MDWLKLVEQTQHCQRNWDHDKKINQDTIDWLLDIGYNMPTKQNLSSVQIVAFTDRTHINNITECAIDDLTIKNEKTYKNPQMNAHVVFLFFRKSIEQEVERSFVKRKTEDKGGTTHLEIGISAGAIALAANSIGLRTGFCRCFNPLNGKSRSSDNITVKLLEEKGINPKHLELGLGVGWPVVGKPSAEDNWDHSFLQYEKPAHNKIII